MKVHILNLFFVKFIVFSSGPLKNDRNNATSHVCFQSEDEISEGHLSSDDDVIERFNTKIEKFEAEKDVPEVENETSKCSGWSFLPSTERIFNIVINMILLYRKWWHRFR